MQTVSHLYNVTYCVDWLFHWFKVSKLDKSKIYQINYMKTDYTVSQKNIPDIFDCSVKINDQILIIFGTKIPDTTCHQMTI